MTTHVPRPSTNTLTRLDQVWMVVSVDPKDNSERVCAASILPGGPMLPLIAADEARLPYISKWAKMLRDAQETPVKIIKVTREEVDLHDS